MREFQLMRYIRRWWWLIAVLSAISGILFYSFISSRQTYRAQTLIEFTNDQAENGLFPSGDEINVQEIRSSSVIGSALNSINVNFGIDSVRSRVSIAENLTDEQKAIQEVKWSNGETYSVFPTQYIISYTTTRQENATDARRVLEAIVDSYIQLYSEKYVSISKVPNSVESLQNLNYDYIEWAEVIDEFIKQDREYLQRMKNMRTEYRSSTTGYSFQDLYNEYNLIYTVYLPSLYSMILNYHVTNDKDLLTARYQYRINQNNLSLKNYNEALELVLEMIKSYTDKNHDTMDYHWRGDSGSSADSEGEAIGNRYVLGQVYDFEGRGNYKPEEITYDSVMKRYTNLRSDISLKEIDNDYCNYILSAFQGSYVKPTDSQIHEVESLISLIEGKLQTLDGLLNATAAEHSEVETIRNVRVRSTVNVSAMTNVKLYTVMIVAVFFVFGVVGAVVVGRSLDFVEYRFYTDPSTDLPNRMRCDMEIEKHSKKVLGFPFTCVVIVLTNMNEINSAVGRDAGNEVLHIFADYIKDCAEDYGFVGYNGGLQFLGLFPDCSLERSTFYKNLLMRTISEFNRGGHGVKIRYKLAAITASETTPLSMRELLSSTMQQLRMTKETFSESEENEKNDAGKGAGFLGGGDAKKLPESADSKPKPSAKDAEKPKAEAAEPEKKKEEAPAEAVPPKPEAGEPVNKEPGAPLQKDADPVPETPKEEQTALSAKEAAAASSPAEPENTEQRAEAPAEEKPEETAQAKAPQSWKNGKSYSIKKARKRTRR